MPPRLARVRSVVNGVGIAAASATLEQEVRELHHPVFWSDVEEAPDEHERGEHSHIAVISRAERQPGEAENGMDVDGGDWRVRLDDQLLRRFVEAHNGTLRIARPLIDF